MYSFPGYGMMETVGAMSGNQMAVHGMTTRRHWPVYWDLPVDSIRALLAGHMGIDTEDRQNDTRLCLM